MATRGRSGAAHAGKRKRRKKGVGGGQASNSKGNHASLSSRSKTIKEALEKLKKICAGKETATEPTTGAGLGKLWEHACDQTGQSAEQCDRETCTGVKSPRCTCAYKRSNQSKRKGLWKKDQDADLLAGVGENPALYERRSRYSEARKKQVRDPAGLKNLGATCYANSVFQCLFNISDLKRDLFMISSERKGHTENNKLREDLLIIDGLQKLFSEIEFSPTAVVNPEHFLTKVLQLNPEVQQDCQEFWTLLHHSVDAALQKVEDESCHNLLKSNFVGQTSYKTLCKKCKQLSESSKTLHDFQVLEMEVAKDSASLESSLATYLSEELLDGDNKYFCDYCNSRQTAVRRTEINKLPDHIIFQLKRFRFDLKTFERKKIKSNFSFPLSVDMSPYLAKGDKDSRRAKASSQENVYDVESIILHKGKSAGQGHYVSLVKREADNLWWQFDDQDVRCIGSDLGSLNNFVKGEGDREGSLMSTQVYIIVYKKRKPGPSKKGAEKGEIGMEILSPQSKKRVSDSINSFKESKESYDGKRNLYLEKVKSKQKRVEKFLELAEEDYDLGQAYCVSTESLATWTTSLEDSHTVDMRSFKCRHGLLDPRRTDELKIVSPGSFEVLKKSVKIDPVLSANMMCVHCLKDMYERDSIELEIEEQNRLMLEKYSNNLQNQNLLQNQSKDTFYISKKWFQRWTKNANPSTTMQNSPTDWMICRCGKILPELKIDSDLKEIPAELWRHISDACSNFETPAPEIRSSQELCKICSGSQSSHHTLWLGHASDKSKRKVVEAMKGITSTGPLILKTKGESYSIIPIKWYYEWEKLQSQAVSAESLLESLPECVESVKNLICEHQQLRGKEPYISFTKLQLRRNSWHQSLHESNVLILTSSMWKLLCNAAGIRDSVEIKLYLETNRVSRDLSPHVSIEPSSCRICSKDDQGIQDSNLKGKMKLWIYGAFEKKKASSKRAMELSVDRSTTVNELKQVIEKKGNLKEHIHALFYCHKALKGEDTLSMYNIYSGDLLHFETSSDGESSSELENGQEEKNFAGTRLMC